MIVSRFICTHGRSPIEVENFSTYGSRIYPSWLASEIINSAEYETKFRSRLS